MKTSLFQVAGLIAFFGISLISVARADGPYHFLKEIPIGGEGGWDCLVSDDAAHRLYVSHATKIVVIDTRKNSVVGEIADTSGVHGFTIASELGRGFSSNGKEAKVSIIDLKTLKTLAKVDTGENPDAILYAAGQGEVYVFNGKGESVTVFDAKSGKVVVTIALPGKPEFAAYDAETGLIYDNIEDKNEVVVIDSKTHQIVQTWPIAPGTEASGLAIDAQHHRLFIGCHNKLMLMMDSTNGRVIASVPIGQGVDANAFDPATQFAFSSTGEGVLTIAHEDTPGKLSVVQNLATQKGARTMALDLKTHRVYLATAQFEKPAPDEPAGARPKPAPGTFKILVYGK